LRLGEGDVIPWPGSANGAADVVFGVRPEDVDIASGALQSGWADLPATVEVVEPLGADTLIFASAFGASMTARVRPSVRPAPGSQVRLRFNLERAHLFDAATGRVIAPAAL